MYPTSIRSLGVGTVTSLGRGGSAIQAAIYPYALRYMNCFMFEIFRGPIPRERETQKVIISDIGTCMLKSAVN